MKVRRLIGSLLWLAALPAAGVRADSVTLYSNDFETPNTPIQINCGNSLDTRSINEPGTNDPGLYFKIPFVENVVTYDKRNLGLTLETQQPIVASDQERLIVDAIVSAAVARANGRRPLTISYNTHPKEKRSLRSSAASPRTCSGDM